MYGPEDSENFCVGKKSYCSLWFIFVLIYMPMCVCVCFVGGAYKGRLHLVHPLRHAGEEEI